MPGGAHDLSTSFNSSFWQRRNSGMTKNANEFDELRANKGKKVGGSPSPRRSGQPSFFVA